MDTKPSQFSTLKNLRSYNRWFLFEKKNSTLSLCEAFNNSNYFQLDWHNKSNNPIKITKPLSVKTLKSKSLKINFVKMKVWKIFTYLNDELQKFGGI